MYIHIYIYINIRMYIHNMYICTYVYIFFVGQWLFPIGCIALMVVWVDVLCSRPSYKCSTSVLNKHGCVRAVPDPGSYPKGWGQLKECGGQAKEAGGQNLNVGHNKIKGAGLLTKDAQVKLPHTKIYHSIRSMERYRLDIQHYMVHTYHSPSRKYY